MQKFLREKHIADEEEIKQKMTEALKGIKIDEFKNCLSSGEDILISVLHNMESTLKVTEV